MDTEWAILDIMTRFSSGLAAASAGCYEASRAAALSGVPERTVYDWARKGIVTPSVSPVQEKLWSFADLMSLRIVAWLRKPKGSDDDRLPASPMGQVRLALAQLSEMNLNLWSEDAPSRSSIVVDQRGAIFLSLPTGFVDTNGNHALPHENHFGLLDPFHFEGHEGPDLVRPRPHLRIVPERVSGEPHVEHTRLTTLTLAGLAARGFSAEKVALMYDVTVEAVREAIDLETALGAA